MKAVENCYSGLYNATEGNYHQYTNFFQNREIIMYKGYIKYKLKGFT